MKGTLGKPSTLINPGFSSARIHWKVKENISGILRDNTPLNTSRYLGFPSLIGKSKRAVFEFLKDRLIRRLQNWHGKLLSQAGKEILIKVMGQVIP